jgi:hypothetical protein
MFGNPNEKDPFLKGQHTGITRHITLAGQEGESALKLHAGVVVRYVNFEITDTVIRIIWIGEFSPHVGTRAIHGMDLFDRKEIQTLVRIPCPFQGVEIVQIERIR